MKWYTQIAHAVTLSAVASPSYAQQADRSEIIDRGLEYLRKKGQAQDRTLTSQAGSGITALAVTAALRNGVPLEDTLVARGLTAMEKVVQSDDGIYGSDRLRNYETCVGMVCFAAANTDGRYDEILSNAEKYVRSLQIGGENTHPWYGGVGYGGPERPDLSNTAYLVEALTALDASPDDEAIQRALTFVSVCQNLARAWQ